MEIRNLFLTVTIGIFLVGCAGNTKKPITDDGANIAGAIGAEDGQAAGQGDMGNSSGKPETIRVDIKGGVEYGQWKAVYFDFDSAVIRSSDQAVLQEIAAWAKENPGKKILVAGHCDDRGTLEYNRSLGQRRAAAAREQLIKIGVPTGNIGTVSYGEEPPADTGHDEAAWSKNRRDEFGVAK